MYTTYQKTASTTDNTLPASLSRGLLIVIFVILAMMVSNASLAAEVTIITPDTQTVENQDTQQANTTTETANTNADAGNAGNVRSVDNNGDAQQTQQIIDPNSLAADQIPTAQELSAANQALLTQNANLQRSVNDLETQVNVLINERSGQLFLYGALTVIFSFIAGIIVAVMFMKKRNDRW